MAHLSILGTGNMGQAIAAIAGKGGHTVQLLGAGDADTPVSGDVIVLAVPYPAVSDVIAQRGEQLAGKIVVDITNPLNFETFDSLVVPADSSATAEIAARPAAVAGAQGLQHHLRRHARRRHCGPVPTTVLIAGDDADAKSTAGRDRHRRRPERHRRRRAGPRPRARGARLPPAHPRRRPRRSPGPAASASSA